MSLEPFWDLCANGTAAAAERKGLSPAPLHTPGRPNQPLETILIPKLQTALILFSFYLENLYKHVEKKSIQAAELKKNRKHVFSFPLQGMLDDILI